MARRAAARRPGRDALVGRVLAAGPARRALAATPVQASPAQTPRRRARQRDAAGGDDRQQRGGGLFTSDEDEDGDEDEEDAAAAANDDENASPGNGKRLGKAAAKKTPARRAREGNDEDDDNDLDHDDDDDDNDDDSDDGTRDPGQKRQAAGRTRGVKSGRRAVSSYFDMETNLERQKRRRKTLEALRSAHSKAKIKSLAQLELPSEKSARAILRRRQRRRRQRPASSKAAKRQSAADATTVCDGVAALVRHLPRDYFLMQQGFNVLVHGFGSKKRMLEGYAAAIGAFERARKRAPSCTMVIAGYAATLSVRTALATILRHYIGLSAAESFKPSRSLEAMSALAVELSAHVARRRNLHHRDGSSGEAAAASRLQPVRGYALDPDAPVWTRDLLLLVHNIDGKILRGLGPKRALSNLAQSPQMHLVASVDHIAAELLWDPKQLEHCRWVWREVHSHEPYLFEGIGAPSLVHSQDVHGSRGAAFVLSSLTPNHISVLEVLADFQLEIAEAAAETAGQAAAPALALQGMEFGDLLDACRDQMFVSTERALRNLLIEFKDHSILGTRISPDGKELLYLTIEPGVIKREIDKIHDAAP